MKNFLIAGCVFLAGCAATNEEPTPKPGLTARDAIELSEANAPKSVPGIFSLTIKATGRRDGYIYLNTQDDYRDRRNVTVVLLPHFQQAFKEKYGVDSDEKLINQTILVKGLARRMKISLMRDGKRSEKYYFQTHIPVKKLGQIKFCVTCD